MPMSKEEEINWLKTEVIPKILKNQKLIENYNETDAKDFQILDLQIQTISSEEAFMLTSCYKAALEYEFKGTKNKSHFFVKKTPKVPQDVYDNINFNALFNNEILAYDKIMPALENFGKADLKVGKYFYSKLEKSKALLITEDFSQKQWKVAQEMFNISLEHILLGVKYLARFHALGFALRHENPQHFNELTKNLKESRYGSDVHPDYGVILRESIRRAAKAVRKYETNVDENFIEDFLTLIGDNYQYGKKRVQPREPLITLCHGDYLRNNVAFKYNPKGQPFDCMMFDLQTLRVSSPMVDLSVFLSLSTLAEVRYTNFELIFATYCDTLNEMYGKLVKGNAPEYLSYNSLLREYVKFLPFSIGICASFLMFLVDPEALKSGDLLTTEITEQERIEDVMTKGGEVIDRELAHQLKELYELNVKTNANIFQEKF